MMSQKSDHYENRKDDWGHHSSKDPFYQYASVREEEIKTPLQLFQSVLQELNEVKEEFRRIKERDRKLEALLGDFEVEKIKVPDYDREMVEKWKNIILERLETEESVDPLEFADKYNVEPELTLLCFDELISEGRIEVAYD